VVDRLPLFPLGTVLFPGMPLPLHVFEPRYRELVNDLMAAPEPRAFGVVAIREGHEVGADALRALYDVGCVALVRRVDGLPDGRFAVMTVGTRRFRLLGTDHSRPYLQGDIEMLPEPEVDDVDELAQSVRRAFADYHAALAEPDSELELPDDAALMSYVVAATLVLALPERQALLEAPDTEQRLRLAADLLKRELGLIRTMHTVPMGQPPLPHHSQN